MKTMETPKRINRRRPFQMICPGFFSIKGLLVLLVAAGGLPCGAWGGEVVYRVGFEETEDFSGGYAMGSLAGQGGNPPEVMPWIQPVNEECSGAEIVGESGGNQILPPQGKQMLQIQYDTGNPQVYQNFLPEAKAIKQDFKVTFLLAVDASVSNGTFSFGIQSSSGLNSGAWLGIRRVSKEENSFGFFHRKADSDGKAAWERIEDAVFEPHQFYKVELQIDYWNQAFGGRVTSADGGEVLNFSDLPLLDLDGHMSSGRGFNRIYVGADQIGTRPFFLVDDITVDLVP